MDVDECRGNTGPMNPRIMVLSRIQKVKVHKSPLFICCQPYPNPSFSTLPPEKPICSDMPVGRQKNVPGMPQWNLLIMPLHWTSCLQVVLCWILYVTRTQHIWWKLHSTLNDYHLYSISPQEAVANSICFITRLKSRNEGQAPTSTFREAHVCNPFMHNIA